MRLIISLIYFFSLSGTVLAQQCKIDSLRSLLPGRSEKEQADILYELAYEYAGFNDTLGVEYGNKSYQLAKGIGDSLRMVKAGRILVLVFRRLEELDSSIALGLELLPVALRNGYSKQAKQIVRTIGVTYIFKANYDLGLYYSFELLKVAEQDHDSIELRLALNNIGLVYFKLDNHQKALHYYHRAVDVKSSSDKHPLTTTFVNMSLCYSTLWSFSEAEEFLGKSFEACQPHCSNTYLMEVVQARAALNFEKGNLDTATVYYLKSNFIAKKLGNKRYQLTNLLMLLEICFQQNKVSLAKHYLLEAESIMEQAPFGYELVRLYSRLAFFYKMTGNVKRRAYYQERWILLMDSLYGQRLNNNLMKIESDHLERANKVRITEQEQLLALKDEIIGRQNALNVLIGVITLLLIALLYVLYRNNHQGKSANRLLDQKVKERTAALESNNLALKQSFERQDATVASAFMNIKSWSDTIQRVCLMGLEDDRDRGSRECLQEIWTVIGRVSAVLNSIQKNDNRNKT